MNGQLVGDYYGGKGNVVIKQASNDALSFSIDPFAAFEPIRNAIYHRTKAPVLAPPAGSATDDQRSLLPLPASKEGSLRGTDGPATSIRFMNGRNENVKLYWLDQNGQRVLFATLVPGQAFVQQTYAGHPWLVTNVADVGLAIFVASSDASFAAIR
jgi:hypothetical protein